MAIFGISTFLRENSLIITSAFFFLSSLLAILQNILIRRELHDTVEEMIKEKDKNSTALEKVFSQKGVEIERLKETIKQIRADSEIKLIALKDDAETRISAAVLRADNNADEAAKWEKYCRICFDKYQRETLELGGKLQRCHDELALYQNAPPNATQPQLDVGIIANIARSASPTSEKALFLEMVKELEKKNAH